MQIILSTRLYFKGYLSTRSFIKLAVIKYYEMKTNVLEIFLRVAIRK